MKLTAIILTLNEENNIAECIKSADFADEVLVFDSGSTDKTVEIAASLGASVVFNQFVDFADQRNKSMEFATHEVLFFIDADERITEKLKEEIIFHLDNSFVARRFFYGAFFIKRLNYFFGKPLKYLSKGDKHIRFFINPFKSKSGDRTKWVGKVHEKYQRLNYPGLPNRAEVLEHPMLHLGTKNFSDWKRKFNIYIPLEHKKRWIPLIKFLYLYFFRLGILDGWVGFQYCVLAEYYEYARRT